ncbi:MAG TPA: topoisomerase C-terminal repeat-containing protein, partial [Xanthobacteraceae bacterium]|nr:topoisomerase C-terminal repeat-containing protein [Xanthobacteraceae bacterium]
LIAEKIANPGRGRRFGGDPGRTLGDHPRKGGPIVARKGRYGPYVSHDGINATLPPDKTPETVTLDEAVALIDARAESGAPSKRRSAGRKPAKDKARPAPKSATGKAAAPPVPPARNTAASKKTPAQKAIAPKPTETAAAPKKKRATK